MFPFAEPASTDRVLLLPHTLYLYCTCYLSAHRTFPMCLSDSCLVESRCVHAHCQCPTQMSWVREGYFMLAIGVFLLVVVLNFVIVTVEHKSLLGRGQGGCARQHAGG